MSIEGLGSYEGLDVESLEAIDVEWRGRSVREIRDDVCIRVMQIYSLVYQHTALTNPAALPQLKAEIIEVFEDLFGPEVEEESSLLSYHDPISETNREMTGAESPRPNFVGHRKECNGKESKTSKKLRRAISRPVRAAGRWIRKHPVATGVIVTAVVVGGVAIGSLIAGAGATAATRSKEPDDEKQDSREPKASSGPNPPPPADLPQPQIQPMTPVAFIDPDAPPRIHGMGQDRPAPASRTFVTEGKQIPNGGLILTMNGMANTHEQAKAHAHHVSKLSGGYQIKAVYNPTHSAVVDAAETVFLNFAGFSLEAENLKREWKQFQNNRQTFTESKFWFRLG